MRLAKIALLVLLSACLAAPAYGAAPTVGGISPSSGSTAPDAPRVFISTYADADGWANLKDTYLLFGTGPAALSNSACLYYN